LSQIISAAKGGDARTMMLMEAAWSHDENDHKTRNHYDKPSGNME